MAADENGGDFGGDGSVRWQIVSGDEIVASDATPEPAASKFRIRRRDGRIGTRCLGVDKKIGRTFVVSIKLPEGVSAEAFIAGIEKRKASVVIRLPIKRVSSQIRIRWGKNPPKY